MSNIAAAMLASFLIGFGAYGLDRGIFVGSETFVAGAPCCPDLDFVQKQCRYLFVTGIASKPAHGEKVHVDDFLADDKLKLMLGGFSDDEISEWSRKQRYAPATSLLRKRPDLDNSYCRLFGE